MKKTFVDKLLDINRQFYDQYAPSFSSTRHQAQPGAQEIAKRVDQGEMVLDLGCGNGTFAKALIINGYSGSYDGFDISKKLLIEAENRLENKHQGAFNFHHLDLAAPDFYTSIPQKKYDWAVIFAVLHHLPSDSLRLEIAKKLANRLNHSSRMAISVWQWQNSPRLRDRIIPWSEIGINPDDLEHGDILMDWRAGETIGYRYVHTFSEESLSALAISAGFDVTESYYSDGKSNDLALYQVWQLKA